MKETYRISDAFARRQLLLSSGGVLFVLVLLYILNTSKEPSMLFAMATVAVIAGVALWRNYKSAASFAASHVLLLTEDAILLRDGPTERRIPYTGIELLTVRRPFVGRPSFTLKVKGIPKDTFYGYEDIDQLLSTLASRLPSDRVKDRLVHA